MPPPPGALLLLRHAKSDWDDAGLRDHARPLSPRGRKAAPLVGRWLEAQGLTPDRVLCSTAIRTRETLELLGPEAVPPETPVDFLPSLYHASPETLLEQIRATPAGVRRLLVVGHNPGMHELIWRLPAPGSMSAEVRSRLRMKLPTGSLAHFRIPPGGWPAVEEEALEFVGWITPRELV